MANYVASIIASLGLDSRSFKAELASVQKSVGGFSSSLSGMPGLSSLLGAGGAAALGAEFSKVIEKGHEIHELSKRFGIDAEQLQLIGNAAELDGISLESTARGMNRLLFAEDAATKGGGKMAEAFTTLGIRLDTFRAAKPDEKMFILADALKKAGLNTQTFSAASELLGKRFGAELIPVLIQGSEEMKKASKEMGIFSDATVENLELAHDSIKKTGNQITVLVGKILGSLIPALKTMSGHAQGGPPLDVSTGEMFARLWRKPKLSPSELDAEADKKKASFDPAAAAAKAAQAEQKEKVAAQINILVARIAHEDDVAKILQIQLGFEEKINKAKDEGASALVKLLEHEKKLTIELEAQNIAEKNKQRLQLSLAELAGLSKPEKIATGNMSYGGAYNPGGGRETFYEKEFDYNKVSPQAAFAARQAKEAQGLEKQAHDLVLNQGDLEGASRLQFRAEQIKAPIAQLKDSEKDISGSVRLGMDAAKFNQTLENIEKNTQQQFVHK
jgi:hypothetical protein